MSEGALAQAVPAFRDPVLQEQYERVGYVVVPFLEPDEVAGLREVAETASTPTSGFSSSAEGAEHAERARLSEEIKHVCSAPVSRVMNDHRIFLASLLVKAPSDPDSDVPPHLDWSFVDEPKETSFQFWAPLSDATVESGGLFVLPRSNRLVDTPRGTPYIPTAFDHLSAEQIRPYGKYVPVRVGEAIVWDARTIHWSLVNTRDTPRSAVGLGVVPEGVQLRHFYRNSDGTVTVFATDDDFYRDFVIGEPPKARRLDVINVHARYLDEATVQRVCAPEVALHPRPLDDGPRVARRTFREPANQARLEEEGFITLPFLDPGGVQALAELYDETHSRASAFYASAVDPDLGYRQHVSARIREVSQPLVEALFADHEILIGNLLVKAPSDPQGFLAPHLDWTIVDEPRVVSCQMWIPLADTSVENGTLHVLPRSHKLVSTPRGTPYLATPVDSLGWEEIEARGRAVELRRGHAVAWDQRLVHWSLANQTAKPRVAVGLTIVPRGAKLQHFFMKSDRSVHQYIVDQRFFVDHRPGEEPEGEDLGPIAFRQRSISSEELDSLFPPPRVSATRRALTTLKAQIPPGLARRVPDPVKDQIRAGVNRLTA